MIRLLIIAWCWFLIDYYVSLGLYLEGLKIFGKKTLGKCTFYIGIEDIRRPFHPTFSFSPVLIQRHSCFRQKSY